jgi:hypothetical protein
MVPASASGILAEGFRTARGLTGRQRALSLPLITIQLAAFFLLCGCAGIKRESGPYHTFRHYSGRSDGLVATEEWGYREDGRAWGFGNRGAVTNFSVVSSNLLGMGGWSIFSGSGQLDISSNLAPVISAGGTAVGNVVGAAAKASAGVP